MLMLREETAVCLCEKDWMSYNKKPEEEIKLRKVLAGAVSFAAANQRLVAITPLRGSPGARRPLLLEGVLG